MSDELHSRDFSPEHVSVERILHNDPNVAMALFFGRGRFNNGVLIQPTQPFEPNDEIKLIAFRNKIWPTVQRMNEYAPAHSRLLKEVRPFNRSTR